MRNLVKTGKYPMGITGKYKNGCQNGQRKDGKNRVVGCQDIKNAKKIMKENLRKYK